MALTILNVRRALVRIRHTGDFCSPVVPLAAVMLAAVVHAGFEDWMFAVGNYICVFFWALAFILVDVLHAPAQVYTADIELPVYEPQWLATEPLGRHVETLIASFRARGGKVELIPSTPSSTTHAPGRRRQPRQRAPGGG